jgi:hypothetical protein
MFSGKVDFELSLEMTVMLRSVLAAAAKMGPPRLPAA